MPWHPREERRLAVMTNWGFLGSFGLCFAITGFRHGDALAGLAGFALLAAAFGAHVIMNRIWGTAFMKGEVALGFVVYALSLTSFVVSWIVLPDFGGANIVIGVAGFGLLLAAFVFYMIASHGVRGSIDMIDTIRNAQLPRAPSGRGLQSGGRPAAGPSHVHVLDEPRNSTFAPPAPTARTPRPRASTRRRPQVQR